MKGVLPASWAIVICLAGVATLNYVDRQVVFSLFPILRAELAMSDVQLGLLSSAFLLTYGVVSLFAGLLAVRWGLRSTIVLSLGIWSAITLASGFVRSGDELIGLRALMGSSEAFYMPSGLALVMLMHGEATRSRATALHQSGNYIGMIAGGTLGGWFAEHWGWRSGFLVLGAVGIVYALFVGSVLRRAPVVAPDESSADARGLSSLAGKLIAMKGYRPMFAVFCLYSAAGWIVLTWMPLYLYERFQMTLLEAGFSATFYLTAGSLAGLVLGAWLSDRAASNGASSRALVPVAGFVLSAVFLLLAALSSSEYLVFSGLAVFGFGRGLYDCNTMPLLCTIAPAELRAGGYSVFNCGGCLTGGVMTALAGWLKAHGGLTRPIEASAIGLLLAAWVLWMAVRPFSANGQRLC